MYLSDIVSAAVCILLFIGPVVFSGGEGHSIFYTGFLDSASTNGNDHPQADGAADSPTSPNGSTTLPAKYVYTVTCSL